ncbi:MAG: hypothetical protein K6A74_05280 [Lachnospiraceae bacterium]|nr:hypothetical protein [Lachnospiraceae bacterium]
MSDRAKLNVYRVLLVTALVLLVYTSRDRIGRFLAGIPDEELSSGIETGESSYSANGESASTNGGVDGFLSASYRDERKPNYLIVNSFNSDPVSIEFTWTSYEQLYFATICYSIDSGLYNYYKGLSRYYGDNEYINYIKDPLNDQYLDMLVENINEIAEKRGYSEGEKVRETINFVQSFTYADDSDTSTGVEWPRYPVETLYERGGDCEDTSILLAGLLSKMGYGTALIKYADHMAVGIKSDETATGAFYSLDGIDYYYIETTNKGWDIGELPEEYKDKNATVIVIN